MTERPQVKILITVNHHIAEWWLRNQEVDQKGWRVVISEHDAVRLYGWHWREGDLVVWYIPPGHFLDHHLAQGIHRTLIMCGVPKEMR